MAMLSKLQRICVDHILNGKVPREALELIREFAEGRRRFIADGSFPPLLLDMNHAARRLGMSRTSFYIVRRDGLIPTVLVNGVRYVRATDLERFVADLEPSVDLNPNEDRRNETSPTNGHSLRGGGVVGGAMQKPPESPVQKPMATRGGQSASKI